MTSLPNNKQTGPKKPMRVASVRRDGSNLRIVVVRAGKPGEPSIVIESFRSEPVADRINTRNIKAAAEQMVGVLPAGCTSWRSIDAGLPESGASEEAVLGTLNLLAEAHAGSSPEHRRSAGVLRLSDSGPRCAGVCAWTQDATADVASLDGAGEIKTYIPAPVALAWLARVTGRASGVCVLAEPDSPAITPGGLGTIIAIGSGETVCAARVLREECDPDEDWKLAIKSTGDSLARGLSVADPRSAPADSKSVLTLPDASGRSIVGSVPSTPGWWEQYGLCVGAASAVILAASDERPLLAMSFDPPGAKGPLLERVIVWLAEPRRAIAAFLVVVALMLLVPLGAAYARLAILQSRVQGDSKPNDALTAAAKEADLYAFNRGQRWPMSKLLAEVIGTAPKGVHIENITLEVNRPVVITGNADEAELLGTWRTSINGSGAFEAGLAQTTNASSGGVRFDWSTALRVKDPSLAMNGNIDSIKRVTADAGKNASVAPEDAPTTPGSKTTTRTNGNNNTGNNNRNRNTNTTNTNSNRNNNNSGRTNRNDAPAAPAAAFVAPSPITDEQINQLDSSSALREWTSRQAASKKSELDQAVRDRLAAEAAKAKERYNRLKNSGGNQ